MELTLTEEEETIINEYLDKKIELIKELNIKEIIYVINGTFNGVGITISCLGYCSKGYVRGFLEDNGWLSIYDILTEQYKEFSINAFIGDDVSLYFILKESSIKQILRNTNLKELI